MVIKKLKLTLASLLIAMVSVEYAYCVNCYKARIMGCLSQCVDCGPANATYTSGDKSTWVEDFNTNTTGGVSHGIVNSDCSCQYNWILMGQLVTGACNQNPISVDAIDTSQGTCAF